MIATHVADLIVVGALSLKDKTIHEHGLISVLRQIHDDLDAAVFDAYGWPHTLTDERILERLVALNKERADEESRSQIRYLRPDFQNPTGHSATQSRLDLPQPQAPTKPTRKPKSAKQPWPATLPDQVRALRSALCSQSKPVTANDLAALFSRASKPRIEELLQTLVTLGQARQPTPSHYIA